MRPVAPQITSADLGSKMAGAPKADDLATELGVEDLYEFLGVRSDCTEKEVGRSTLHGGDHP